jgi:antirestriction protein ArdC
MKPWNAEHAAGRTTRPLRWNGLPYQGINVLLLWAAAMEKGYAARIWMTFKQARELKASVRKGEHGSLVVYADKIIRTEADPVTGEEAERAIPFMKGFTVFNVEQIDGLPEHYYAKAEPRLGTMQRIDQAEAFFAGTGAAIRYGGTMASYNVSQDFVQMPPFEAFRDAESFYSTLGHETVHWTRHESRLDRNFGRKRFGDEGYAMEELVAELGSAFLSADLDLTPELRDDHASYIASWIKVLKDDKRAIFTAARFAEDSVRPGERLVGVRYARHHNYWRSRLSLAGICELRRQQLEVLKAAQPRQLALFELKDDCRPVTERTAAGRYAEPTFFEGMPARRESAG